MSLTKRQKSQLFSTILIVVLLVLNWYNGKRIDGTIDEINQKASSRLDYTAHAKCRMDCRKISRSEVEFINKEGKINHYKSDPDDKPCPTIAKEGRTDDGQMVRIVFAACPTETKVVTAIDLEKNYDCYCK